MLLFMRWLFWLGITAGAAAAALIGSIIWPLLIANAQIITNCIIGSYLPGLLFVFRDDHLCHRKDNPRADALS